MTKKGDFLPPELSRCKWLHQRVTIEEKDLVKSYAAFHGMNESAFVLWCVAEQTKRLTRSDAYVQ